MCVKDSQGWEGPLLRLHMKLEESTIPQLVNWTVAQSPSTVTPLLIRVAPQETSSPVKDKTKSFSHHLSPSFSPPSFATYRQ